ncbi:MAG: hypothetical protein ACRBF0_23350 [Calditrichia bacterium]
MKQKSNWLLRALLIAGIICGLTTIGFAQAERSDSKRKTETVKRNSDKKKKTSEKRVVKRKKTEVTKRNNGKKKVTVEKRVVRRGNSDDKRENAEKRAQKKRYEEKKRDDKNRTVIRGRNGNRNGDRGNVNRRDNRNGNRNGNRGNVDRRNNREGGSVSVAPQRNNNRNQTRIKRRRFTHRNHHNVNRHHRSGVDAYIHIGNNRRWNNHSYWRKYKRPRKKYYAKYGWSPFFHLDLSPSIRFGTYTRPLIWRKTNIVFTKEYDLFDYRPGDAIGYSVHIDFNGRVKVYDRYYDEDPILAETFYIGNRKLRKLNRILKNGRYYRDGHCMLDNYGDDDHRGYATIAYRSSRHHRLRSVSLNLAAPEEYYPQYMSRFMDEIEEILFENDEEYWD